MQIKLLFAFCSCFLAYNISGQTFQKTYGYGTGGGDYGRWVEQTNDSGFIIAGSTHSIGAGGNEGYLLRTDANGDTLWTKTYGGTGWEELFSVHQNTDNGFIVSGVTASFGASGSNDAYVIRTNANGDTLWTRVYGGALDELAWSVDQTNDGGFIVAGETKSAGAGGRDVFAVRTDANGDTIWTRAYGGIGEDVAYSVEQTNDNGFVFCGLTRSFTTGATGIYVIKTDGNGDTLWTRSINGSVYNNGQTIKQTDDNGYIITAYLSGDMGLIKLDSTGNVEWAKAYGRAGDDYPLNAEQTTDGGYFICGSINLGVSGPAYAYLVRTDANGDSLWTKAFNITQAYAGSGAVTNDGGFIIASHYSVTGNVYLIKVDSTGNTDCNPNFMPVTTSSPVMTAMATATLFDSGTLVNYTATMSYAGGPVNDLCSTVSIEEKTETLSMVYPNPFVFQATLSTTKRLKNATLTLDNCFGQTIKQIKNINGQTITLSRDDLPGGLYLARLTQDNQIIETIKIVISD
jgi:hypothetical protein